MICYAYCRLTSQDVHLQKQDKWHYVSPRHSIVFDLFTYHNNGLFKTYYHVLNKSLEINTVTNRFWFLCFMFKECSLPFDYTYTDNIYDIPFTIVMFHMKYSTNKFFLASKFVIHNMLIFTIKNVHADDVMHAQKVINKKVINMTHLKWMHNFSICKVANETNIWYASSKGP